jgi:hypothetical protein
VGRIVVGLAHAQEACIPRVVLPGYLWSRGEEGQWSSVSVSAVGRDSC